jgi:hypothetical protein
MSDQDDSNSVSDISSLGSYTENFVSELQTTLKKKSSKKLEGSVKFKKKKKKQATNGTSNSDVDVPGSTKSRRNVNTKSKRLKLKGVNDKILGLDDEFLADEEDNNGGAVTDTVYPSADNMVQHNFQFEAPVEFDEPVVRISFDVGNNYDSPVANGRTSASATGVGTGAGAGARTGEFTAPPPCMQLPSGPVTRR